MSFGYDNVAQVAVEILVPTAGITPPPPLGISCGNPPDAFVGQLYSHAFPASGGTPPYTFAKASGSFPPGLVLDNATGALTGTPTTAGIYPFSIKVTDVTSGLAIAFCSVIVVLVGIKITLRGVKRYPCKPIPEDASLKEAEYAPELSHVKRAM